MTSREECNSRVALLDGILIPRPPSLAGKANSLHSRSLSGGLPVRAGKRTECSINIIKWSQQGADIWDGATQVCPLAHVRAE